MKTSITQNKYLRQTAILFVWLLFWQILSLWVGKSILLPSPLSVIEAFFFLAEEFSFWLTIFSSICRILGGYLLSILLGIFLAVLCYRSILLYHFFAPAVHTIKATPVVSFSILVLLWVKTDMVPIVISFCMVFPLIWSSVSQGIRQTDPLYLEMAKVYGFSPFKTCRMIYVPSVLPYLLTACQTGIGMAWKSGIAAEVICTPAISMGKQIYETKLYLETPQLFVWTACAILCSILLEKLFLYLLHFSSRKIGIYHEHTF